MKTTQPFTVYEAETDGGHKLLYAIGDDGELFLELPLHPMIAFHEGLPVVLSGRSKGKRDKMLWQWSVARERLADDLVRCCKDPDAVAKIDGIVANLRRGAAE